MSFTTATATAPGLASRLLLVVCATALLVAGGGGTPASAECGAQPQEGFRMLFDGTAESLEGWTQSGPGSFQLQDDCTLMTEGGLGLLWYSAEQFDSYTLRLDWKLDKIVDNSGIFVGFPAAGADTHNAAIAKGYEIQIDQIGRMDGQPRHYTGAIYDIQGPNRDTRLEGTDSRGWNTYEITVDAPKIVIELNGEVVNEFTSVDIARDISQGHVGLQNHGGPDTAYFRNVQVKPIEPGSVSGGTGGGGPGPIGEVGTLTSLRNNVGIAQTPASNANFDGVGYSYSAVALRAAGVTPGGTVTADGVDFTWPETASGAADNVIARGQTVRLDAAEGAEKISFLTVADHGPSTGTFAFNYEYTDAEGNLQTTTVERGFTVSDWTLNGGGAQVSPGNVTAITTQTRVLMSAAPDGVRAHVFAVTLPLEPGMALRSVTLPKGYTGAIHIFDIAFG